MIKDCLKRMMEFLRRFVSLKAFFGVLFGGLSLFFFIMTIALLTAGAAKWVPCFLFGIVMLAAAAGIIAHEE